MSNHKKSTLGATYARRHKNRGSRRGNMAEKTTLVIAAVVGAFAGIFLTRYMVSGHQDHLVEVLIAQFIGNGLLAAILVTLLVR
jgi:hypothetical protein